jgi:hypothetical protein
MHSNRWSRVWKGRGRELQWRFSLADPYCPKRGRIVNNVWSPDCVCVKIEKSCLFARFATGPTDGEDHQKPAEGGVGDPVFTGMAVT